MRPAVSRVRCERGAGKPAGQGDQACQVDQRLRLLMRAEGGEDLGGDGMLDRQREEAAEDHVGGRVGGVGLDVHLADRQPRGGSAGGLENGGIGVADAAALEGRVDDAALAGPGLAGRDEDPVPQQRRQPLAHPRRLGEVAGPFLQDQADQRGVVAEEAVDQRAAELGHPGAVEPLGQSAQQVAAKAADQAQERAAPLGALRAGRLHGRAPAGRVMRAGEGLRPAKRCASVSGPAVIAK